VCDLDGKARRILLVYQEHFTKPLGFCEPGWTKSQGFEHRRQSFGSGVLLSRSALDLAGPVKIVPAALFLWLLAE